MKYIILIPICFLLLKNETLFSQDNKAFTFLKNVNSFDFVEPDSTWKYGRMDLTSYSLKSDTTEYVTQDRQKNFLKDNPFFLKLLNLKQGEIITDETDPDYYYKSVSVDSVLSVNFGYVSASINRKEVIHKVYAAIIDSIRAGKTWAQSVPFECNIGDPLGENKSTLSSWIRAEELDESFLADFIKHKAGEIYIYENTRRKMIWIINKTEKDTFFKRNKIVTIGIK